MKTLHLTPDAVRLVAALLRMHRGSLRCHFRRRRFWAPRKPAYRDIIYARELELVKFLLAQLELFDEEEL